jgi:uncharacterized cupin superfamily protein
MPPTHAVLDADAIEAGYEPFIVGGEPAGSLSEIAGATDVRAGVFRIRDGEFPDREPTPYHFETDEYIWVIEGEVRISVSGGDEFVVRAGESAFFAKGIDSIWTFVAPFRKFSVEVGIAR